MKREILSRLAIAGTAVIYHPESPIEEAVAGTWLSAGPQGWWKLPADLCLTDSATMHWLFSLGDWAVFAGAQVPVVIPDFFRAQEAEVISWMDTSGLTVAIASFPDDVHWAIVLGGISSVG